MNYLAHAFLSFHQPDIIVGNMISDFIKGKKKYDYTQGIQTGISLHRAIDEFTDSHPVTAIAKQYFRPAYRLYAGAFIDVVYDHFLANDTLRFPDQQSLLTFTEQTYSVLTGYQHQLPAAFRVILPYMTAHNWLYNYRTHEGIRRSFGGLVRRAAYLYESDTAFAIFETHYDALRRCYADFFPALQAFAAGRLQALQQNG